MGIICQDERKKTNKNRNNNNNNEIDIDEMLSKINEKFNIINMSKSRDNFNFSKLFFHSNNPLIN